VEEIFVEVELVMVAFVNTPFTPVIVPVALILVTARLSVTVALEIVATGTVNPEIFKVEILAVLMFAVAIDDEAAVVVAKEEVPVEFRVIVLVVEALVVLAFKVWKLPVVPQRVVIVERVELRVVTKAEVSDA
jgi:hypothetical protein